MANCPEGVTSTPEKVSHTGLKTIESGSKGGVIKITVVAKGAGDNNKGMLRKLEHKNKQCTLNYIKSGSS